MSLASALFQSATMPASAPPETIVPSGAKATVVACSASVLRVCRTVALAASHTAASAKAVPPTTLRPSG